MEESRFVKNLQKLKIQLLIFIKSLKHGKDPELKRPSWTKNDENAGGYNTLKSYNFKFTRHGSNNFNTSIHSSPNNPKDIARE